MFENENAGAADNQDIGSLSSAIEDGSYKDSSESAPSQASAPVDIPELEKFEKFKFAGKEWTAKDFQGAYMMQADYTRKTQQVAEERKYFDNLQHDLDRVKADPSLGAQFKSVYPEKFHKFLGYVSQPASAQNQPSQNGSPQYQNDPKLIERLDRIESDYNERRVQAASAEVDAVFETMGKKYPFADEEMVIARAQSLLDSKRKEAELRGDEKPKGLNDKEWDSLFKSTHDRVEALFKKTQSGNFRKQTSANERGRDVPAGGGIAGSAPRVPKNLKEASAMLLESGELN